MSTCSTAKRRRAQARKDYRHLPPLKRPKYSEPDAGKSARRMQERVQKERRMAAKPKG